MSDPNTPAVVPVSQTAKDALADLKRQIAGVESMLPGARVAGLDTTIMESTLAGLKAALTAIEGIPGVK